MITPPTPDQPISGKATGKCPRCSGDNKAPNEPGLGIYCEGCGFPLVVDEVGVKLIALPKEAFSKATHENIRWFIEDNDEFCNKKGWWG